MTRSIFISASFPSPAQWSGAADPLLITDAVTAVTRAVLAEGSTVLTGGHPTIVPLILYVARDVAAVTSDPGQVVLYQSDLFRDRLPEATKELMGEGNVRAEWTEARGGDPRTRSTWGPSLDHMRNEMLHRERPSAAVFVGGMDGIRGEFELAAELISRDLCYPIAAPGGEAASLPRPDSLAKELGSSRTFPHLATLIMRDVNDKLQMGTEDR